MTANATILTVNDPHRSGPRRGLWSRLLERASVCVVTLTLSVAPAWAVEAEHPAATWTPQRDAAGIGFDFGDSGLWLASYVHFNAEVLEDGPEQIALDDISLILRYEPSPRFAFFLETDFEDTLGWLEGNKVTTNNAVINLERLYVDYAVTPKLTLRGGKFLTPFGIWNQVRRAPLTWTVDRPIITERAFPPHITGAGVAYKTTRSGWTSDATLFGQAQDELVTGDTDITASSTIGGRFALGRDHRHGFATVGASTASFENDTTNRWENVFGADLELTIGRNQLITEFIYSKVREPGTDNEVGLYVQDAFPLWGPLFGVLRYEYVDPRDAESFNGYLVGLAWRPNNRFVAKVNYQFVDDSNDELPRGLLLGIAFFL